MTFEGVHSRIMARFSLILQVSLFYIRCLLSHSFFFFSFCTVGEIKQRSLYVLSLYIPSLSSSLASTFSSLISLDLAFKMVEILLS